MTIYASNIEETSQLATRFWAIKIIEKKNCSKFRYISPKHRSVFSFEEALIRRLKI